MFDIDGVLADFHFGFTSEAYKRTGGLYPKVGLVGTTQSPIWKINEAVVPREVQNEIWEDIEKTGDFWLSLPQVEQGSVVRIYLTLTNHQVYFVTSRPGLHAKEKTEVWLNRLGYPNPTVVIVQKGEDKKHFAKAVRADYSIEDKLENAVAIAETCKNSFLVKRRYNEDGPNRITFWEFIEHVRKQ